MSKGVTSEPSAILGAHTLAARVIASLDQRSREEQARLEELRARGGTHVREAAAGLMLDVGPEVGQFLNVLSLTLGARSIVEVGGSVGYSTIWLAEAASRNGGRVVSFEPEPGKHAQQRQNLERLRRKPNQAAIAT